MSALKTLSVVIHERRATAHFDETPVPDSALQSILEAGQHAPSGYNLQPWRFLVLRSADRRAALRRAAYDQVKITEAPVVIVAFAPRDEWKKMAPEVFAESSKRGAILADNVDKSREMAIGFVERMDRATWLNRHVMIAFTHLMLAAEALGWDTAPMEGFDPAAVRKELSLPSDAEVIALLCIGRVKGNDRPFPGRLPLSRIVCVDSVDKPWAGVGEAAS